MAAISALRQDLLTRYGALLTSEEVARVLRFKSKDALMKARRRDALPIALFSIPGRKGLFATSADVASWVESLGASHPAAEKTATEETKQ